MASSPAAPLLLASTSPRRRQILEQLRIPFDIVAPSYEEKAFPVEEKRGRLRLIASPDRAQGSVLLYQDARVYAGLFDGDESATLTVEHGRRVYVHVASGKLIANDVELDAGDALQLTDVTSLSLQAGKGAEVLVFDLPGA